MSNKLLLYIDILGFSDLVAKPEIIEKIYQKIDRLNVFSHAGTYNCIVFSDTILVYSNVELDSQWMSNHIMWMCEFAQDLHYRLIGLDIHFRALLTIGVFQHEERKNIESFFGPALVDAYNYEKKIQCCGLFMDQKLQPYSNIFFTERYDAQYYFVYIQQNLLHYFGSTGLFRDRTFPIDPYQIKAEGMENLLSYEFVYLKNLYRNMVDTSLSGSVKAKFASTWQMLRLKAGPMMDAYEASDFDASKIVPIDWEPYLKIVGTEEGFHG